MSADPAPSGIPDVRFGATVRHLDRRGAFRELWRASDYPPEVRFVQANQSSSAAGVLRGLHFHQRQMDRWVVTAGRALVALVDVRPMLTRGHPPLAADRPDAPHVETRELRADDWVDIPAGVAHGFLALEPLELIYLVTNEYDGADELGFAWDDPDAAVPWPPMPATPDGRPILSERDRSNPSLAEVVARLRG
jgi:dTDP-4-dehydrorhamnose 3,5-epimerase